MASCVIALMAAFATGLGAATAILGIGEFRTSVFTGALLTTALFAATTGAGAGFFDDLAMVASPSVIGLTTRAASILAVQNTSASAPRGDRRLSKDASHFKRRECADGS